MRNRIAEYDLRPNRPQTTSASEARLRPASSSGPQPTLVDQAASLIGEYPYAALAAAAITGIIVGWLVKRR